MCAGKGREPEDAIFEPWLSTIYMTKNVINVTKKQSDRVFPSLRCEKSEMHLDLFTPQPLVLCRRISNSKRVVRRGARCRTSVDNHHSFVEWTDLWKIEDSVNKYVSDFLHLSPEWFNKFLI